MPQNNQTPIVEISNLDVFFNTTQGQLHAIRSTHWSVSQGETLVILGESGAGKSVSVHAVSGLLPSTAKISGSIKFDGEEILGSDEESLRKLRAEKIGVIFQDPLAALDPCFKVGAQIAEIFTVHRGMSKRDAWDEAVKLLDSVQIPDPERRANQFSHQLSGGQRQRVVIAMAIALSPTLLIADEPTTALDASVQVAVLELIKKLRNERKMAIVLITHNIGVAASIADRIAVMYGGRIVEIGDAKEVLQSPRHPYTQALLASMPKIGSSATERLITITGTPPSLATIPGGCSFHPRCSRAIAKCSEVVPEIELNRSGSLHSFACHNPEGVKS
jgi:ABC-type dipeptide/oligopeptide/nickel transport system ATPase component